MSVTSPHPMVTSPHPMVKTQLRPCPTPKVEPHLVRLRERGFRLVRPQGVGSDSSDPRARAPTCPVPRGGLRLVRPPRVGFRLALPLGQDFHLAHSLGVRFATGQKQWPQGGTRTASTTMTWRCTPRSTSRAHLDMTGSRIRPCWETHVAHRVNRLALCYQLPA